MSIGLPGAKELSIEHCALKRRTSWPIHLPVLLAYTLLALALTWPLVAHLGSHVPGNGADDPPLTWNLWWVRHALLDLGTNPFDCKVLFYPLGINLAFYTLTVLNGLLSIPLQATLGLVPASNLLLLSSFILSGYGAFLLASYFLEAGKERVACCLLPASFLAGLLYAFASSKLFYAALGQWNIASSQWIPFYLLYLFKTGEQPRRWRYPILAGLFLLFQAYAEMTYASFLVLFTALWLIFRLPGSWRLWLNLALLGLIFAVGLLPILAMMVPDLRVEGDILVEGGGFADIFSADLLGFLVPTMHHPLFGSLVESFHFDHTVGQHLYLGYSVLILALTGIITCWRRPEVKFWLVSTLFFWLLSLGPTLRINGHDTGLPLPFTLVAQLPFFKGNRYPSRYSVLLVLSLAMLVGFGTHRLLGKVIRGRGREAGSRGQGAIRFSLLASCSFLLASSILFEHLSIPLPLSDMRIPPVYSHIAAMPGDFTLLDLPVAWRNGFRVTGPLDPIIMFEQYYQTAHGKRLLAGNTSRNPPLKFQYFTEAPVLNTLIALETGHTVDPTLIEADRPLAAELLRFFDIQAIVVHPAHTGPDLVSYVETVLPAERFYEDNQTIAYRVRLPPWPATWTIRPGDERARLSYAEGWGPPAGGVVWAQRRATRLLVPLNGGTQQMTFRAYAPEEGQRLWVEVNGQVTGQTEMAAGWMEYRFTLPAEAVREGLNQVWLRFEALYPAGQARLSPRTIGRPGLTSPVNLVVQSAGEEAGDFGHIYVNGRDVAPNERGYNVAVINPQSGAVEQTAAFDTHLDEGASQALADFLDGVPAGYLVAVAAADEVSRSLGQEGVDALRSIGATGDLRGRFRWGHAIIGLKGAPPGTALEASDWMRPVTLVVGEGVTEPQVAAALTTLTFTAQPEP